MMSWRCAVLVAVLFFAGQSVGADDGDKFLPDDTGVILRLDVKSMLDTPALKNDKENLQKARALVDRLLVDYEAVRKHMASAGIDAYRDVHTITTALPADGDVEKAFVILQGAFDPVLFRKAAADAAAKADSGLKLTKIGGQEVIEIALPGREGPLYAYLVDRSTLLAAGNKDKLAAALKVLGNDKADLAKETKALLKLLDAKQHLSFAGTRSAVAKLLDQANQPFGDVLGQVLEGAETVQVGLTLGTECDVLFAFGTKDEKTARQFFQNTTLGLALLRGGIAKKAKDDADYVPLAELLKGLRTRLEGTTIVWRSQVSLATAEKLMKNLTK